MNELSDNERVFIGKTVKAFDETLDQERGLRKEGKLEGDNHPLTRCALERIIKDNPGGVTKKSMDCVVTSLKQNPNNSEAEIDEITTLMKTTLMKNLFDLDIGHNLHMHNLQQLNLTNYPPITDEDLSGLHLSGLQNLTKLNLGFGTDIGLDKERGPQSLEPRDPKQAAEDLGKKAKDNDLD